MWNAKTLWPLFRQIAAFVFAGTLVACGGVSPGPEAVIAEYVDAVARRDWQTAASLLSVEARGGAPRSVYADNAESRESELVEQAAAVRAALEQDSVSIRASVPLDRARSAALRRDEGRWRLDQSPPLLVGADTPMDALATLVGALEGDAVAQVLALLSDEARDRYVAEIDALIFALVDANDDELSILGDTASLRSGGLTINFEREDGTWRVSSVEQPFAVGDYFYEHW